MQPQHAAPLTNLDIPQLLQVLQGSLSQDPAVQKTAEQTLRALEARTGYLCCLVEVVANKSVDHSLRWLAATQLKNCVIRHWRPNVAADGGVELERNLVRGQLLRLLEEDDNQIASQVAVTIAKVARSDYPRTWATLFDELLSLPHQPDCATVLARRVYLVLHMVLKELATKRLAADQRVFAQLSEKLLQPLWQQWLADTAALSEGLPAVLQGLSSVRLSPSDPLLVAFERWLFVLKALRRIVLFGFPTDATSGQETPAVAQISPSLHACLAGMLTFGPALEAGRGTAGPAGTRLLALLERGLLKLAKTHVNLQERFPWTLLRCGTLSSHLELSCLHIVNTSHSRNVSSASQRTVMQLMLFVHQVGRCKAYSKTTLQPLHEQAAQLLSTFWSPQRAEAVLNALLHQYLPLTARELREWHDSPEEFHLSTDIDHQDHLRPTATQLFQWLVEAHHSIAAPLLQRALSTLQQLCPSGAPPGPQPGAPGATATARSALLTVPQPVLLKAALYDALGLSYEPMCDAVDFGSLLQHAVLPDIACVEVQLWPVRRQAMKVIGQWVAKMEAAHYPAVYSALSEVLAPADQDAVLALTAVTTLRSIVDDWGFTEEALLPHLPLLFERLAGLLTTMQELDATSQVFAVINLLIQRMGAEVQPLVPGLLQLLPQVWTSAQGQSLLQLQVLSAMSRLLNALGMQSPVAYPMLLPLLHTVLGSSGEQELVLLEDGLALWLVALRNAPALEPAQQLLQFLPHLRRITSQTTEHLPVCCAILRSSLYLLNGHQAVTTYAPLCNELMLQLLGNVNERGMGLLLGVLELCVQLAPDSETVSQLRPALQQLLLALFSCNQSEAVIVAGIAVLSRMLLQHPSQFLALFSDAAAAGQSVSPDSMLCQYVDGWMDNLDNISHALHRKLAALAACRLLTLPVSGVLDRLDLLMTAVSAAAAEGSDLQLTLPTSAFDMAEAEGDESVADSLDAQGDTSRREQVATLDPVNTLRVAAFYQQCFNGGRALHGTALQQAISQLDPHLLAGMPAAA